MLRGTGVAALTALLLAGCSAPTSDPVHDPSDDVPFTACTDQCTGEIDGAQFQILMPDTWNGTLLLYSHGYRSAVPLPPENAPVQTAAEPAPGYSSGERRIAEALLAKGFAMAGSGWARNGWAVEEGVSAGRALSEHFASTVGKPNRVYVWGDSLGGLVSQELAEQESWVSGAAPLCGAVAGVVPNMDLALDLATGVQALIDPSFKTHGYASAAEAIAEWQKAGQAVRTAAVDVAGGGTADVLALGALVDAAPQTKTYDAADPTSKVKGTAEAVITGLGFGTFGRYDVEQRFGQISDNVGTDYAARFSAEDHTLIDTVGGKGATERIIAELEGADPVKSDPGAVTEAQKRGGDPERLAVPTITLHTAADPLVVVQNESSLREQAQPAGGELVQLFTVPPATYEESSGAPYGAGHCNFTPASRIGMVTLLDDWVRRGVYPAPARVHEVFGPDSGYSELYVPAPWPASQDR